MINQCNKELFHTCKSGAMKLHPIFRSIQQNFIPPQAFILQLQIVEILFYCLNLTIDQLLIQIYKSCYKMKYSSEAKYIKQCRLPKFHFVSDSISLWPSPYLKTAFKYKHLVCSYKYQQRVSSQFQLTIQSRKSNSLIFFSL